LRARVVAWVRDDLGGHWARPGGPAHGIRHFKLDSRRSRDPGLLGEAHASVAAAATGGTGGSAPDPGAGYTRRILLASEVRRMGKDYTPGSDCRDGAG